MNQKQSLKTPFTIRSRIMRSYNSSSLSLLGLGLLLSLFVLPFTVQGKLEISNDFYGGNDVGWTHYMPTTAGGANPSYTFPTVGSGDLGYELSGPPLRCEGLLQRGGSYRSESYSEFSYSADFLNYHFEP